jgi:hypothetical protein
MLKRIVIGIVALAVIAAGVVGVLIWASHDDVVAERPEVPFAPLTDPSIQDPDNPIKVFRVDFAKVENDFPLSREDLMRLTPGGLLQLNQEEVDQIYARLTAGPIPDGPYEGDLFFARGGEDQLVPRLEEILGGIEGRFAGRKIELLEDVGRSLWKGKMFYRDQRLLRNFIDDFQPLRPLIGDAGALEKAEVPREGWLSYILPTTDVWLMFPAKLYCGQSLLDARRESIVIDYAYSETLPGYQAAPDTLVGRGGLRIRDEIRMIRPGFYLGRAYARNMFLLNFTLYNPEVADAAAESFAAGEAVAEDCWIGEQVRRAAIE